MQEVNIVRIQTAMNEQPQELLEDDAYLRIHLDQGAVAHEQRTHGLQGRYLEGKIERRDHDYRAKGPAIAARFLACVVTWVGEPACQVTHSVTGKIFQEHAGDNDFIEALLPAFWHYALCQLHEVSFNIRRGKQCCRFRANPTQVDIAVSIFKRVVKAGFGTGSNALQKWGEVRCVGYRKEQAAVQWINDVISGFRLGYPLSTNEVLQLSRGVCRHPIEGVNCRELSVVIRHIYLRFWMPEARNYSGSTAHKCDRITVQPKKKGDRFFGVERLINRP